MAKKVLISMLSLALICLIFSLAMAEKLNFGTPARISPHYVLPPLAAQEKGIWKKHGLEVEWTAFRGGAELHAAVAAGSIDAGLLDTLSLIQTAARGVPELIVADIGFKNDFFIWVRADSPLREPKDLRGTRMGVVRFGGVAHIYARAITKALGLEKEVKLIGGGGIREEMALLKAGKLEGRSSSYITMAPLKFSGEVRELVAIGDYLPREWVEFVLFARRDLASAQPQAIGAVVRAFFEATSFVMDNPEWAVERSISFSRYQADAARGVLEKLVWGRQPAISRKAIENVRNFIISYEILSADKVPSLDQLYTERFVR